VQLFDPQRPTLASGRPCLLNTQRVTGVPSFDIELVDHERVFIEVMLRYDKANGFVWYKYECHVSEVSKILADFSDDPEKVLKEKFNWDPSHIIYEPKRVTQNFAPTIKTEPKRGRVSGPVDETLDVMDLD